MKKCDICLKPLTYSHKHDCYFCGWCDKWMERSCLDPECIFCANRPQKPCEDKE